MGWKLSRIFSPAQLDVKRAYQRRRNASLRTMFNPDGTHKGYFLRRSADRKAWILELDGNFLGRFVTESDAIEFFNRMGNA